MIEIRILIDGLTHNGQPLEKGQTYDPVGKEHLVSLGYAEFVHVGSEPEQPVQILKPHERV